MPKLVIKEELIRRALLKVHRLIPFLILKDRWGACADLWMDYGQGHLIALP